MSAWHKDSAQSACKWLWCLQAPKDADFDRIINMVQAAPEGSAFVFNCQMGRGRTTTGMVIASLAILQRAGAVAAALRAPADGTADALPAPKWFAQGIRRARESQSLSSASEAEKVEALRAGHLLVVRSIVRVLPQGLQAKAMLDAVIDACAAMQNIRAVIAQYRGNMLQEPREGKRAKLLSVCTVRKPPRIRTPDYILAARQRQPQKQKQTKLIRNEPRPRAAAC